MDGTFTGTVTTVTAGGQPTGVELPARLIAEPNCPPPKVSPYFIGQLVVLVTEAECYGTWTTTASSTNPAFYIRGESTGRQAADEALAIMKTIRQAAPAR